VKHKQLPVGKLQDLLEAHIFNSRHIRYCTFKLDRVFLARSGRVRVTANTVGVAALRVCVPWFRTSRFAP